MSLSKRLALIFRAKASRALDRAEDPRETLDYSYQKQMEMVQQVRRGRRTVTHRADPRAREPTPRTARRGHP